MRPATANPMARTHNSDLIGLINTPTTVKQIENRIVPKRTESINSSKVKMLSLDYTRQKTTLLLSQENYKKVN